MRETGARPGRARRQPSRSSRCPTATSACAATSTRASRTATPGTYLNSFYELRPLPYAEGGYGYPESGQTIINVTNGKLIRLLVDDEPFDVRYGELHRHERVLDLRAGTLTREVQLELARRARRSRCAATRLVSFTQRAVAAICYEVEAVDDPALIVVQSELVANEQLPTSAGGDPRVAAALHRPAGRRAAPQRRRRRDAGPPHPPLAGCAWPRRWTTRSAGPRAPRSPPRPARTSAAPRSSAGWSPAPAARGQVPGLRLVVAAVAAGACTTRSAPRSPPPASPAGTGCSPSSAPTSTSSGPPPTSRSTATPSCSRRCGSRCSTCCRPAPGPSAGRSRPRA